jgi:hypothetical protein
MLVFSVLRRALSDELVASDGPPSLAPTFTPWLGLPHCGFGHLLLTVPQWWWQRACNKQSTIDRPIMYASLYKHRIG